MVAHNIAQAHIEAPPLRKPVVSATAAEPQPSTSLAIVPVTPFELLQMAVNRGTDIDQLTKLLELHERWEANEARKAYDVAMSNFKKAAPTILKNTTASFLTKKGDTVSWDHPSLDHACAAVIPALSQHGITHAWRFEQPTPGIVRVICVLTHVQGHSRETPLEGPPDFSGDKSPIHALYSAVSHLERYTLLAATGLAPKEQPKAAQAGKPAPAAAVGVSEERKQSFLDRIRNASSREELRKVFSTAYPEANAAGDTKTMAEYIAAKEARFGEVR